MSAFLGGLFKGGARPVNPEPDKHGGALVATLLHKYQPLGAICIDPDLLELLEPIPETAMETPAMTSIAERRLMYNFAKRRYSGQGLIIDAGIFLGASTRCFGEGLRANKNYDAIAKRWASPIISFDRGVISPIMPDFFRKYNIDIHGKPGESFVDAIVKNIKPVSPLVDLRIGDICVESANLRDPVEILFLDVLKLPKISADIISTMFPLLIPGVSLVIQQDYFDDRLPYICVDQEYFGDYFSYVGEIQSTALFMCTKAIPREKIAEFQAGIPAEMQASLSSIAVNRSIDHARRFLVALSKVRLMFRLYGVAAARAQLDFVRSEFPQQVAMVDNPRIASALRAADQFIDIRDKSRAKK